MNDERKPKVEFNNSQTYGEEIEALVRYYVGTAIGTFVLEEAIEKIKCANKKIEEEKEKIILQVNRGTI